METLSLPLPLYLPVPVPPSFSLSPSLPPSLSLTISLPILTLNSSGQRLAPYQFQMFSQVGRYKATWKREFKLSWRKAGPPNHHDDAVASDQ